MNPFNIISEEILQVIVWTIIHSIWQISLAGIVYLALKYFFRNSDSRVKYLLGLSAMAIIVVTVIFTAIYQTMSINTSAQPVATESVIIAENVALGKAGDIPQSKNEVTLMTQLNAFVSYNQWLIGSLWILGVCIFMLRLIGGMIWLKRLKSNYLQELPMKWYTRMLEINEKLGIKKSIMLAESTLIKVPMVIGYFKPVVLLPAGAITGLSPEQIEAIILHELAHIKRHDYLINIVQSVVESILFYHPVIWWISSEIKDERENCCDDIAVQLSGDSVSYARALASLRIFTDSAPAMAITVVRNRYKLLSRITRILQPKVYSTGIREKIFALAGIVLFIMFIGISTNASHAGNTLSRESNKKNIAKSTYTWNIENLVWKKLEAIEREWIRKYNERLNQELVVKMEVDTPPGKSSKTIEIKTKEDGDKHKIKVELDDKGNINKMKVNGKKVPESQYGIYTPIIKKSMNVKGKAYNYSHGNSYGYHIEVPGSDFKVIIPEIPPLPELPELPEMKVYGLAPIPPIPAIPPVPPVPPMDGSEESMKKYEKDMKEYEKSMQKYEKEMEKWGGQMKYYEKGMENFGKDMEKWAEKFSKEFEYSYEFFGDSLRNRMNLEMEKHNEAMKRQHEELAKIHKERHGNNVVARFEDELLKDGLIKSRKEYEFKISKSGFIVNGVQQPKAVFDKYKELYYSITGSKIENNNTLHINIK